MEIVISCAYFLLLLLKAGECHIINHLPCWLARAVVGNIGPRLFMYGPWANILFCYVRGYYFNFARRQIDVLFPCISLATSHLKPY